MYEKILVPYDGSKPSRDALKYAAELALLTGNNTEITLIFVIENIMLPPLMTENVRSRKTGEMIDREGILKEIYFDEKMAAKDMLDNAAMSIDGKSKIKKVISYGRPPEKIIEFARKEKIDLIIIGNVGLSGISKLKALGSVSRCVSECSPCPVLIMH